MHIFSERIVCMNNGTRTKIRSMVPPQEACRQVVRFDPFYETMRLSLPNHNKAIAFKALIQKYCDQQAISVCLKTMIFEELRIEFDKRWQIH